MRTSARLGKRSYEDPLELGCPIGGEHRRRDHKADVAGLNLGTIEKQAFGTSASENQVRFADYFADAVSPGFGASLWNVSQSVRILSQSCTDKP